MLVPLGRNNFSMFFSIMSLVQTSASLARSSVWCRDTNHLTSRATRWLDESGEEEDSEDFSSVLEDSEVLDESPSWWSERSATTGAHKTGSARDSTKLIRSHHRVSSWEPVTYHTRNDTIAFQDSLVVKNLMLRSSY